MAAPSPISRRALLATAGSLAGGLLAAGCNQSPPPAQPAVPPVPASAAPAPGIAVHTRTFAGSDIAVIDVDLQASGVRVEVAARKVRPGRGAVTGECHTVREWLELTGAAAGINGGFFGQTVAEDRKEIIGLLRVEGVTRSRALTYRSTRRPGERYSHAAFGLDADGMPDIQWATSGRSGGPLAHAAPILAGPGAPWPVRDAVACGPVLVREGKVRVTDRDERLVSPGALPRTFLGYTQEAGRPRHLVLVAATGLTFEDAAAFLMDYCQAEHGVPCWNAMALDGGGSTQLAYREGNAVHAPITAPTTVPTAILVHAASR